MPQGKIDLEKVLAAMNKACLRGDSISPAEGKRIDFDRIMSEVRNRIAADIGTLRNLIAESMTPKDV